MEYWKPIGKAPGHGHLNEKLVSMRLLQVLEDGNEKFFIGHNIDSLESEGKLTTPKNRGEKIGELDDIVCKVVHMNGKIHFYFVQLKHAINRELIVLDGEKTDERKSDSQLVLDIIIQKCYKSFLVIYNLFKNANINKTSQRSENQFINCNFDECEKDFVYITTRRVSEKVQNSLQKTKEVSKLLQSILNPKGDCFRIPDHQSDSISIDFQKICNEDNSSIFKEFSRNFVLCTGQMYNEDIEQSIKQNMISFKKDLIYVMLKDKLEQWYNSHGQVKFLTINDHFFHNNYMIAYKQEHALYLLSETKIVFRSEFIESLLKQNLLYTVFSDEELLIYTSIIENILKHLGVEDYVTDNKVLVIDDTINISLLERSVRTNSSYNRIFVFVNSLPVNKKILFDLLKQFVKQEGKYLHIFFKTEWLNDSETQYFQHTRISFSFNQLSNESQEFYLDKNIEFQGINTTLRKVFKDSMKLINAQLILKLAEDKRVQIGEKMKDLGAVGNYYIPRYFVISSVEYFVALMKQNPSDDIHILYPKTDVEYNENCLKDSNCRIIKNKQEFKTQCELYPNRNIHLFEYNKFSIKYLDTKNSAHNLDTFLKKSQDNEVMISETFLTKKCVDNLLQNSNVIISDIAGNGKSTTLVRLSTLIKENFADMFVVLINLNSIREKFKIYQTFSTEEAIVFITKHVMKSSQADSEIFKHFCSIMNKVIIFMDFCIDGRASMFQATFKSFIEALKSTKIKTIIIATQPHCLKAVQSTLPATVVHLDKFDKDQQEIFLEKFWEHKISEEKIIVRNNKFVKECAVVLVHFIHSTDKIKGFKEVTGIPLLLKIFSEVHFKDVKKSNDTKGILKMLTESYSFLNLYDKFVDGKLNIYLRDKLNVKDEFSIQHLCKAIKKSMLSDHTALAFKEIFLDKLNFYLPRFITADDDYNEPERLGLLLIGDGMGCYMFIHKSFAEYFCAVALIKLMQTEMNSTFLKIVFTEISIKPEYLGVRKFMNDKLENLWNT